MGAPLLPASLRAAAPCGAFLRRVCLPAALLLTGCAAPPALHEPASEAAWLVRKSELETLTHWQVQGRIAVRTEHEGWQAHFDWQQQDQDYRIRLRGPFGQGGVELSGNPGGVWFRKEDQPPVFARNPELLLQQHTGWRLPVSGMGFWLRGIPTQKHYGSVRLNADGQLQHMEQDGWQIDYRSYQDAGHYQLPVRLQLERESLRVKIVIDRWQTS